MNRLLAGIRMPIERETRNVVSVLFALFCVLECAALASLSMNKFPIFIGALCGSGIIVSIVLQPYIGICLCLLLSFTGVAKGVLAGGYMPAMLFTLFAIALKFLRDKGLAFKFESITGVLLLWGAVMCGSALYAMDIDAAVVALVPYFRNMVLFFMIILTTTSLAKVYGIMVILICAGVFSSLAGIYDFIQNPIVNMAINRVHSFVGDPNTFAFMILPLIGFCYAMLKIASNKILKFVSVLALFIIMFTIALSLSRGGLIALGAALLIIFMNEMKVVKSRIAILLFVVVLAIVFPWELVLGRLGTLGEVRSGSSLEQRIRLLKGSLRMLMDHPIIGVGTGNYITRSQDYCDIIFPKWAHNMFMHVAVENGIIGISLFGAVFYKAFKDMLSITKDAAHGPVYCQIALGFIIATAGLAVSGLFLSEHLNSMLYVQLALIICLKNLIPQTGEQIAPDESGCNVVT